MENFDFISYRNNFEFYLSSYKYSGIIHEKEMMLTVTLELYPDVPAAKFPFKIQYREYNPPEPEIVVDKKNTTESGFEVFPFALDLKLANLTVSGYKTTQYLMPSVKNSMGKTSPMYIELPKEVREFAVYDQLNRIIHIERTLLKEKHEGTYELVVEIGYGHSTMEKRHNVTMFLILEDLAIEKPPEPVVPIIIEEPEIVPEPVIIVLPPVFTKTNETVFGGFIPEEEIKTFDDYVTKESLV